MGKSKSIELEINEYLPRLNKRQKETLLTVAKTFAQEQEEPVYDKAFIAELDKRFEEMKAGKVKTYSFEEVKAHARQSYEQARKKKK